MNLFKLIGSIFKPAAELIDNIHTSDEERLQQKAIMLDTQVKLLEYALDYEQEALSKRAEIIVAEAKSESWITRNWRPVTMLSFVAAVLGYWFGLTPDTLTPEAVDSMFTLVQIGLGGYVVGRSAEKTVVGITRALKKREDA